MASAHSIEGFGENCCKVGSYLSDIFLNALFANFFSSANIPMLVSGDFNSIPGSAAHCLLVQGRVPHDHPELSVDPLGILRPPSKLCHELPLVSAYSALLLQGPAVQNSAAKKQRNCMDESTGEPKFTNCTVDFRGAIDYIFYTGDSLVPSAVLELPDETDIFRRNVSALPNAEWSSGKNMCVLLQLLLN